MREAVDLRQSQPGSLPERFRGEERLENARQHIGRDAHTGVGHRQRDELALELIHRVALLQGHVARRECDRATAGHGIARVDRDIDQRQFQFGNIDLDRPDVVRYVAFELDIPA